MRIGLSSTTIEPNLNNGHVDGIGVYTQQLLKQYQARNQSVVPTTYPPMRKRWNGTSLPYSTTFPLPCSLSSLSSLTPLYRIFNRNVEKQIDIFHSTDHRIPRLKNTPVIATLHDAIMFKYPEWCNPRLRDYKNWLLKQSGHWADHYISISQAMVGELVEFWGIDEKKISVIHHGVNEFWLEKVSDAEKQAVMNKYCLQPGFLLFVGTLQPRKNIDRIIQAFKRLPDDLKRQHKIVIVGKDGWQTQDLMREINQLVADDMGVWLKYISTDEVRALYQSAKVFLFPSLSEGFGMPILEAYASGTPVITSTITSMPEVAGDAALLIDPFNTDELHDAMHKLLTDDALCQDLIRKGQERVRLFRWDTCAEKTLAVYQKVSRGAL